VASATSAENTRRNFRLTDGVVKQPNSLDALISATISRADFRTQSRFEVHKVFHAKSIERVALKSPEVFSGGYIAHAARSQR